MPMFRQHLRLGLTAEAMCFGVHQRSVALSKITSFDAGHGRDVPLKAGSLRIPTGRVTLRRNPVLTSDRVTMGPVDMPYPW